MGYPGHGTLEAQLEDSQDRCKLLQKQIDYLRRELNSNEERRGEKLLIEKQGELITKLRTEITTIKEANEAYERDAAPWQILQAELKTNEYVKPLWDQICILLRLSERDDDAPE